MSEDPEESFDKDHEGQCLWRIADVYWQNRLANLGPGSWLQGWDTGSWAWLVLQGLEGKGWACAAAPCREASF